MGGCYPGTCPEITYIVPALSAQITAEQQSGDDMQKGAIYLEQDYIANRREYILRARNSFSESRKDTDEELINTGKAAIWKVKWLLCICLFVVFVLCDKGKLPFPGTAGEKDTKWMYRQLEENYDYTKLQKYVMIISDFAKNK